MNDRIKEAFHNQGDNYILPFFWMHGAEEPVLRELMGKVYDVGIKAVCLESRPHPDYVGEQWWHDVDIILDEAQKRDMKVWILDDSHFPTGQANGEVAKADNRLKRWSLCEKHYDFTGPVEDVKFEISLNLNMDFRTRSANPEYFGEEVVAVLLGTMTAPGKFEIENVTDQVEAGWLYVTKPEGQYRVWILTKKMHASMMMGDAVSNLDPESVRILIDTVYEAHYKRYGQYFGNTIAGFFSDEPGFFNKANMGYGPCGPVGKDSMPLPWTEDVMNQLTAQFGDDTLLKLPGLFCDCSSEDAALRYAYMDIVSKKYEENFTNQLGDWCREHGVMYIGHIVEDEPQYKRLGCGCAHYFRALRGQGMSGIDVVLNQLLPDKDGGRAEFHFYGLAQLGASLAQQNPLHDGRAMCEIFGAFGWVEGVTLMKWMADHMLVNGINTFVPHAFTEKEFPDPDCPPHFYARGNNPQYPFMANVFTYMNRMAHLFQGGVPVIKNAIFFEAEADWAGQAEDFWKLGKEFLTRQIPYHVLCMDFLKEAKIEDGKILVGKMAYENLFVTKSQYMPAEYAAIMQELAAKGASIHFVDAKPVGLDGNELSALEGFSCLTKEQAIAKAAELAPITVSAPEYWLRVYPYQQGEATLYMVFNESGKSAIDTKLTFPAGTPTLCYDVLNQKMTRLNPEEDGSVRLILAPEESLVLMVGYEPEEGEVSELTELTGIRTEYTGEYKISLASYTDTSAFGEADVTDTLYDISRKTPGFAGKVKYELTFDKADYKYVLLERTREGVEVFLNGRSLGKRVAAPYLFELGELQEKNNMVIELATTLVNAVPDGLSCQQEVPPTGMRGPVVFL